MTRPGENLNKPIIDVAHHELTPADPRPNKWASECPVCKEGTLMVTRDSSDNYWIQPDDHCLLCGQRYRYTDVEDMRRKDWAG